MERQPSLHITEINLSKVLAKLRGLSNYNKLSSKELAKLIVQQSKGISCNNRVVIVSNEKLERKTNKILKSSKEDTTMLASLIHMIRIKKKHRGIVKIDQDHREWGKLKELVQVSVQFCNDFQLEKKAGFIKYLELGFSRISSYRNYVHKLVDMSESIGNEYEANQQIEDDKNPRETLDIHNEYVSMISTRTGIQEDYRFKPLRYINFLKVREITDKLDIPSEIYIKAQFEGLAWASAYPDPTQLINDKAIERLNKYLFENKIKIKSKGIKTNNKKDLNKALQNIKKMI